MDIPYDLIHKLEDEYGSLALVPDNNLVLKNIRKDFYEGEKRPVEIEVTNLVNSGYSVSEIAIKLNFSQSKTRKLIRQLGLKIKPCFRYVAIKRKNGQKIYSKYFNKYRKITHQSLKFFDSAKFYLNEKGYDFKRLRYAIRFSELNIGDQYLDKNNIYTKC